MLEARSGQLGVKTAGRPSHSESPHICEFFQQQLTLALGDLFRENPFVLREGDGERNHLGTQEQRPPAFLALGSSFVEDKFSTDRRAGGWGEEFWDSMHYIYCAFYLYYYYISSTSDHQALEPRGWGPLPTALCSYQGMASGETRAQLTLEVSFTAAWPI